MPLWHNLRRCVAFAWRPYLQLLTELSPHVGCLISIPSEYLLSSQYCTWYAYCMLSHAHISWPQRLTIGWIGWIWRRGERLPPSTIRETKPLLLA